jgi:AhpD family alkylhydroperoxidase
MATTEVHAEKTTTATPATAPRIEFDAYFQAIPEAVTALRAVGHAVAKSGLEHDLIELIKIRASQINGCAFCIQFHLNDARKLGVTAAKQDLLAAWRDAGIFSAREMAALAWTERVTLLAKEHVSDEDFAALGEHFSQNEIIFLTATIAQINFWNRIAATFRFTPQIPTSV